MPVHTEHVKGGYKNYTPSGSHSKKPMTLKNAIAQANLLRGVEHGWKPTGKKAKKKKKKKIRFGKQFRELFEK